MEPDELRDEGGMRPEREQRAVSARIYADQAERLRDVFGARGLSAGLRSVLDWWIETAGVADRAPTAPPVWELDPLLSDQRRVEISANLAYERATFPFPTGPALEWPDTPDLQVLPSVAMELRPEGELRELAGLPPRRDRPDLQGFIDREIAEGLPSLRPLSGEDIRAVTAENVSSDAGTVFEYLTLSGYELTNTITISSTTGLSALEVEMALAGLVERGVVEIVPAPEHGSLYRLVEG